MQRHSRASPSRSWSDLAHLSQVSGALERLAIDAGRSLTTISAGGGLPVPYREGESYVDLDVYFDLWDATRRRLEDRFGHKVSLEIEPGRYGVAGMGLLVARVKDLKETSANEKGPGNRFIMVDAGFNARAEPVGTPTHWLDVGAGDDVTLADLRARSGAVRQQSLDCAALSGAASG